MGRVGGGMGGGKPEGASDGRRKEGEVSARTQFLEETCEFFAFGKY